MTKDEIKKARAIVIEGLHAELRDIEKEEERRHAELEEHFGGLRNMARGKAAGQIEELLEAAMILLDEDEAEAPRPTSKPPAPAAKVAETTPAPAAAQQTAPKTGGPRPVARTLPSTPKPAPADSELPDAGSVFG